MTALGFIETKGLLAAIEAADAMLKAAEVRLLEKNLASGGLVTITIAGEVSAVQASVDAAVAAIQRIKGSALVSKHVIARPDEELAQIIATKVPKATAQSKLSATKEAAEPDKTKTNSIPAAGKHISSDTSVALVPTTPDTVRLDISQLKKMSLSRLRQVAQTIQGLSIPQGKIASADRKVLIEAIVNAYRQREE